VKWSIGHFTVKPAWTTLVTWIYAPLDHRLDTVGTPLDSGQKLANPYTPA